MQQFLLRSFVVICLCMSLSLLLANAQNKTQYTVVLDAGHGGKDPGKPRGSADKMHEKEVALAIALKVGGYLSSYLDNVNVLYTRKNDVYLTLEERATFANENNADLFVSIHANSSPKKYIFGTETHVYSHKLKASRYLAELIQKEFETRAARKNRGVFDAKQRGHNLYVTQYTEMPSVLVETGFLSNPKEEAYLNTADGQAIIASAIFRAIRTYLENPPASENRSVVYKVQVMASSTQLATDGEAFDGLSDKVIEYVNPDENDAYPYKYLIGREYDIERAKTLAKKASSLGYKGAFIVKFEN